MMWAIAVIFAAVVLCSVSALVGALVERRTGIVARLDLVDMEPSDSPDEVEDGTWDEHERTALRPFRRDPDAEQWQETAEMLIPDHGYEPARGQGIAVYPRRTA